MLPTKVVFFEKTGYIGNFGYSGFQPGAAVQETKQLGMFIVVNDSQTPPVAIHHVSSRDVAMHTICIESMFKAGWWDWISNLALTAAEVLSQGQGVVVCPGQPELGVEAALVCAALTNRLSGSQPRDTLRQIHKDDESKMLNDDGSWNWASKDQGNVSYIRYYILYMTLFIYIMYLLFPSPFTTH